MRMPLFLISLVFGFSALSFAQEPLVHVTHAWVRSTVPGQKATGAFMTLNADKRTKLVALSAPVAGVVEVHEMKMQGDIMRMRALPDGLVLPAAQAVVLGPGGLHVMLMDLKKPLSPGDSVALTLVFQDDKKVRRKMRLQIPVRAAATD